VNSVFLGIGLRPDDVESTWAGLRPLIHEAGKAASEVSRKDEIFISDRRLISIAGGKLTGYRKMAERVVDRVFEELHLPVFAVRTHRIRLEHAGFSSYHEVREWTEQLHTQFNSCFADRTTAEYMVHTYGRAAHAILTRAETLGNPGGLLRAELEHTVAHEMVQTALDFIERRTGRLNFDIDFVRTHATDLVKIMAEILKWDESRSALELNSIDNALRRVNRWKEEPATA